MRYVIRHETRLAFPAPVREHHRELRLAPVDDEIQRLHALRITIEPAARLATYTDVFGNLVHYFDLFAPHAALVTRLEAEVETRLVDPFDFAPVPPARERAWIADVLRAHPPLWDFVLHRSPFTPDARVFGDLRPPSWGPGQPLLAAVQGALAWVQGLLAHVPGASDVDTPLATVLEQRAGACQDFAHLLVTVVRGWGVPARYVMGYLDPGYDGEETAAAQATHGWAEVMIPGAGWRGLDAIHGLVANDTYVRVAIGRDHRDAVPQRGTFQGLHAGTPPAVTLAVSRHQQQ